jgi:hypothetical protein
MANLSPKTVYIGLIVLSVILVVVIMATYLGWGSSGSEYHVDDDSYEITLGGGSATRRSGRSGMRGGEGADSSSTSTAAAIGSILQSVILVLVTVSILLYVTHYILYNYFGIDISSTITNLFTPNKGSEIDISISQVNDMDTSVPAPVEEDEVFNIPDNTYTYDDAKLLCKAYDSTLATYSQVESTYNDGGEWCNYGWSADQLALFPTQTSTYDGLQKLPNHKHDCGRPGINGGYIANPNVRFGVNCYGKKPKMTLAEENALATATPYPETIQEQEMETKVNKWKDNISSIMVSPFNYDKWSEY